MNRVRPPLLLALFALTISGAAVAADDQATPAATAPATAPSPAPTRPPHGVKRPAANSDDEVVCKREDELGSRLGGNKVCMTRRDWRQQSNDAGDAVNNAPRPH